MSNLSQFINSHFARYDLSSLATTETLDLSRCQVFRIDASAPRTLTLASPPGANRAMTVVINLIGASAVAWPSMIEWDSGEAPELGENFTRVVLFWDGTIWTGFRGVAR